MARYELTVVSAVSVVLVAPLLTLAVGFEPEARAPE